MTDIDFFARRSHYIDHMLPVWNEYTGNSRFFIPESVKEYAHHVGMHPPVILLLENDPTRPLRVVVPGHDPIFTCAYGDMEMAYAAHPRPLVLMEHGVGLTPGWHPGYAGGTGRRISVSLFLAPNEYIRKRTAKALPNARQIIIGTPKLDRWAGQFEQAQGRKLGNKPTIVISFHWDGSAIAPEAANALSHYTQILPELAKNKDFILKGHSHPRFTHVLVPLYEKLGIEYIPDFDDVMDEADLYINDCSSTMYEFLVTGKPVIVLNTPQFRRDLKGTLRFWDYSDVGIHVNEPEELLPAIMVALQTPDLLINERWRAIEDLYPFLGRSATQAAGALEEFVRHLSSHE